jgi:hypothetical protein
MIRHGFILMLNKHPKPRSGTKGGFPVGIFAFSKNAGALKASLLRTSITRKRTSTSSADL